MIYTYKELLIKYKTRRKLATAIKDGEIYRVSRGIYSSDLNCISEESICKAYPRAIITGLTAFSYYELTTDPGQKIYVTIPYKGTRINNSMVSVNYQQDSTINIGVIIINKLKIYDKERMLIELFRFRNRLSPAQFSEIVNEYRKITSQLDGYKLSQYLEKFKYNKSLKKDIYNIIF